MKDDITYVVIKHLDTRENTLGYTRDPLDKPNIRVNVMAVHAIDGGDPLLLDKQILVRPKDVRPALPKDFESYLIRKPEN